jgi:O-antigen ligase
VSSRRIYREGIWLAMLSGGIFLFSTPFTSYDPINIPKFLMLCIFGFGFLGYLISRKIEIVKFNSPKLLIILGVFLVLLLVNLIFNNENFVERFFGSSGRQTGFLTYLSLLIVAIYASQISNLQVTKNVQKAMLFAACISAVYGLIQFLGKDPFDWINPYSPVFAFLGNPNFLASFLGVSSVLLFALLFDGKSEILWRLTLLALLVFFMIIIALTKSQQGFLVFATGGSVVFLLFVKKIQIKRVYKLFISSGFLIGGVFGVLGLLNRGFLADYLYKTSISSRGDYWRAAWSMTLNNPLFGVGLDGYRDHYRISRDYVAVSRFGPEEVSDSAHNIFLEFSSTGGLPLLICYVGFVIVTMISIIRIVRVQDSLNPAVVGLIGAWVGYTVQSVISINQIALATCGWIFSGLIIGYEFKLTKVITSKSGIVKESPSRVLFSTLGIVLALVLTIPVYLADAELRASVKSGDAQRVINAANKWPQDVIRMNIISNLLRENGFEKQALPIARAATERAPHLFTTWRALSYISIISPSEKAKALQKMKSLDPLNPDLP